MNGNGSSVTGVLRDIRFHRESYLIGRLENGTAVKGTMPSPQIGMEYAFRGRWERSPKYGETFVFLEYESSFPTGLTAIRSYLMENCKWIGPEISKRLVNTYGESTLTICKEAPDKVAAEISGITSQRAREISAMLRQHETDEKLQLDLKEITAGTHVTRTALRRIIEAYGEKAPGVIREHPYRLIEEIDGVGFTTADEVAVRVGYNPECSDRITAGLLHILKQAAFSEGHTCMPVAKLLLKAREILSVDMERIGLVLGEVIERGYLVKDADSVSLPDLYESEHLIARKIKELASQKLSPGIPCLDDLMADQVEAIRKAMQSSVFILTGPPGTGKTYTIKRIIQSFPDARIALAAPTGKASKRIYEESGMPASTIHKLLEPQKTERGFAFTRNAEWPIEADLIVLDEMSMVDTRLMASFLDAVKAGTRLVMVGDTYQLPSVGPGNILGDLIASGIVPAVELSIIKRQDEGLIIRNCHHCKNGRDIELDNSSADDFFFLRRETPEAVRDTILDLLTNRIRKAYGYDPLKDVQVLAPLREKTLLSCRSLNEECQNRLNPNPPVKGCRFREGDKVIQTRNRYELDLINGDIGYIRSANAQERTLYVDFENPSRRIELPMDANDLELAYAITVHKFQGSEAPVIIIPVHRCFGTLITQRNLLYTAMSRARKLCLLVGQRGEVGKMIRRNKQQQRYTGLARCLRDSP